MRSQLTRSVFRRLLSNEPLIHCPHRSVASRPRHVTPSLWNPPSRTLFGFSRKAPREPSEPQLPPGLSKMLELNMTNKTRARPPPLRDLVLAWQQFFKYKTARKEALNNIQAQHAVRTFKHLQQNNLEDEEGFRLEVKEIRIALEATRLMPTDDRKTHNELAKLLYAELLRRNAVTDRQVLEYASVLAATGDPSGAKHLAMEHSGSPLAPGLFRVALKGYMWEDDEAELLDTFRLAESAKLFHYGVALQAIMTQFYASRNDVVNAKKWFSKNLEGQGTIPDAKTMDVVLRFSIRNGELEWCKAEFRNILNQNPPKAIWDVLFKWAAVALGKGVEDVERMIEAMIRCNPDNERSRPDSVTINGLVELAMSRNDSYLAERYIALGKKYNIQPNAQTFILQMDYRISAGDLVGTQAAYEALQGEEVIDECDLPAINRYLRALCEPGRKHYDRIMSICSDLEERKARLEADTVSALCMMYLSRGELNEVFDTLQANAYHYTLPERLSIIDKFVAFSLDRNHGTAEAWEAYEILRNAFGETPISIRTQLMNGFFGRKRSDMACYVFGHMRQHPRPDVRPVLETYIDCFRGIAHCEDKESLDMVHNMLKMDSSIEPNTKLYNSLMMAYTACDEGDRALDFWDDITNSREGPSYESLELVFKACYGTPFGDRTAREVWGKMRRMEIDVTKEVFVAYICALAGQAKVEEAEGMIETAGKDFGLKPDAFM
jgi:hypothetical protein